MLEYHSTVHFVFVLVSCYQSGGGLLTYDGPQRCAQDAHNKVDDVPKATAAAGDALWQQTQDAAIRTRTAAVVVTTALYSLQYLQLCA